ncbi:hypothetical protein [Pseudomonas fluorescens]|nr:hypothetical protein [Pseudomonas fluorescens]
MSAFYPRCVKRQRLSKFLIVRNFTQGKVKARMLNEHDHYMADFERIFEGLDRLDRLVLLLMWLWPDPSVKPGDTSLMQFLMGTGIGSAINVVPGFVLNRQVHADGVRHHFFFMPMQWPALAIMLVCAVIALLK